MQKIHLSKRKNCPNERSHLTGLCGNRQAWSQYRSVVEPPRKSPPPHGKPVDNSQDHLAAGRHRDPRPRPCKFKFNQPGRQRRRLLLLRLRRIFCSISKGANVTGSEVDGRDLSPASRRHLKTWLTSTPCRRATSETLAPSSSVSSTMASLRRRDHFLRRPVPVITSIR